MVRPTAASSINCICCWVSFDNPRHMYALKKSTVWSLITYDTSLEIINAIKDNSQINDAVDELRRNESDTLIRFGDIPEMFSV